MTPPASRKNFWTVFILFNLVALPGLFLINQRAAHWREASREKPLPVYGALGPFQLKEKSGRAFGLKDLQGKPWIANFMFTRCPNECPAMNFKISLLQDTLKNKATLVSFSVDPEKDTPEALGDYAKRFNAKEGVWFFLTGPKPVIGRLLEDCHFAKADDPLLHALRLVLIDGRGRIRGYYDYADGLLAKKLTRDLALLKEKG